MIGTYAAVVAVCAASLAIGQAAVRLCGVRRWSWASPAVGLALLGAACWGTARMPGEGLAAALLVLALTVAAVSYLRGRVEGLGEALEAGWPVALLALLAASLPFAVEGHFGVLGTSFNPDMSQHLLATDRLADGHSSQLQNQGYPLGPHAVAVALEKGLGVGLVQGFSGITVAVSVLASLTALTAFTQLRPLPRTAGALLVGFAYVVASYFAQGAFKETIQALFFLAFVLTLREAGRGWSELPLRFVPAAQIAAGSVYAYSFPSLIWLGAAVTIWAAWEAVRTRGPDAPPAAGGERGSRPQPGGREPRPPAGPAGSGLGPAPIRALLLALAVFAVLALPELGRMLDFQRFETFDPNGPGLGNLFGQVSPFEALGIWPSGDFRLAPGDGAVPAIGYYLGVAFAAALLVHGLIWCWRRRESAILAALAAAALAYVAARAVGTPYTAAKAIEIGSPLVALAILLPLLRASAGEFAFSVGSRNKGRARQLGRALALGFVLAAGGCSLLALANAPVGPTSYSPALTGLRPLVEEDATLVIATPELLTEQHGAPYITWELRGGRVCIAAEGELEEPPPGVGFLVTEDGGQAPFPGFRLRRRAAPYSLWEATGPVAGQSPCPLIAVRQARQAPAR